MKEEENAATCLVPHGSALAVINGPGKHNLRASSTRRSQPNPSFLLQLCILSHDEAELAAIKPHGFFVVADDKGSVGNAGNHSALPHKGYTNFLTARLRV